MKLDDMTSHQLLLLVLGRLSVIEARLRQIGNQEMANSAAMTTLIASATAETTVVDSVLVTLQGLADQIRNGASDQQAMMDLAASLDAEQQKVADAIAANTPAA